MPLQRIGRDAPVTRRPPLVEAAGPLAGGMVPRAVWVVDVR